MAVDCRLRFVGCSGFFPYFTFKRVHLSVQSEYAIFSFGYVHHLVFMGRGGGGVFRISSDKQFVAIIRSAQRGNRVFALAVSFNGGVYCRRNLE